MQKIKFQIKGMDSSSCAFSIEEKLKNQTGIIKAKVDYDSQKATIIYDKERIDKPEIYRIIKELGDYQIREIKRKKGEEGSNKEKKLITISPKTSFFLGTLVGFSIFSLILNIVFISAFFLKRTNQAVDQSVQVQNLPSSDDSLPPPESKPESAIQTFEITKDDHVQGNFEAPITLVEFSSFECSFCVRFSSTIKQILTNYPDQVRHVFKHFPLSFQPNSFKAAEASECASEQGKFWEMHEELYKAQSLGLSMERFKEIAKNLKLDLNKFNNCLDSGKYIQKVEKDFQEGIQKGVEGTPATFVNGRLISGALPYEALKQIIDNLLNQQNE